MMSLKDAKKLLRGMKLTTFLRQSKVKLQASKQKKHKRQPRTKGPWQGSALALFYEAWLQRSLLEPRLAKAFTDAETSIF